MNPMTLAIIAGIAYVLYQQGFFRPRAAAVGTGQHPILTQTPGGSVVNIPGVGAYRSGPGGSQLTVDPNFFSRLFPRGGSPSLGPERAFVPESSPALPGGTWDNITQVTGGAWDAYRAGERDPQLDIFNMPIGGEADPSDVLPPDPGIVSVVPDPCEFDPLYCGNVDYAYTF